MLSSRISGRGLGKELYFKRGRCVILKCLVIIEIGLLCIEQLVVNNRLL